MYVYSKNARVFTDKGMQNVITGELAENLSDDTLKNFIRSGLVIPLEESPLNIPQPKVNSVLRSVKAFFRAPENKEG